MNFPYDTAPDLMKILENLGTKFTTTQTLRRRKSRTPYERHFI